MPQEVVTRGDRHSEEPSPDGWVSVEKACQMYRRTRTDLLAILRTFRDINGPESAKVSKSGPKVSAFRMSAQLHEELRRKK